MDTYLRVRRWGLVGLFVGLIGFWGDIGEVQAVISGGYVGEYGDAYYRGDYATALKEWRPLAERGNGKAQLNIGFLYHMGQGVPKDYIQAMQWYRKAAAQGYSLAQVYIGSLYAHGQGVPQDYAQAAQWYRKATESENPHAQFALGDLYANGQGVPKDFTQAAQWYEKASQFWHIPAHIALGDLYANGQGVQQNLGMAYQHYSRAADPPASHYAGDALRDRAVQLRDATAARITQQEESERQRIAQAKAAVRNSFVSKFGVQKLIDEQTLTTNPFIYKGTVVGVHTGFRRMFSGTEALFHRDEMGRTAIFVTGVPSTQFSTERTVVMALKVLGTKAIKVGGGELTLPYGEYVGVFECRDSSCKEFYD